jgi:hypothetical protein
VPPGHRSLAPGVQVFERLAALNGAGIVEASLKELPNPRTSEESGALLSQRARLSIVPKADGRRPQPTVAPHASVQRCAHILSHKKLGAAALRIWVIGPLRLRKPQRFHEQKHFGLRTPWTV